MAEPVLGIRELNRALLERQLLLRRSELTPINVVERLLGLQAQAPRAPYIGLWTRLDAFDPAATSALLADRELVRLSLQRGTVHLVSAADCLVLRPFVQPLYERQLASDRRLRDVDVPALLADGRALLEEQPRTPAELRAELGQRWPNVDGGAVVLAIRCGVPCVQVPPRGMWGASGQPRLTTTELWLGRPLDGASGPEPIVLRYLAAFGPATVADIQTWSGLTKLGEVFDRLRPELRTYRDPDNRELFDVPDAVLPDPDTPAPVRFLPEYDNLLRSHADRTRVLDQATREALRTPNDSPMPTFLVDGFVRGTWRLEQTKRAATLNVTPFGTLGKADRAAVTEEAERLVGLVAAAVDSRTVELAEPS